MTGSSLVYPNLSTMKLYLLLAIVAVSSKAAESTKPQDTNSQAVVIDLDGDGPNGDRYGEEYTATVNLNGVDFPLKIDNTQSHTWIAHKTCQDCQDIDVPKIEVPIPEDCGEQYTIEYPHNTQVKGCLVDMDLKLGSIQPIRYPVLVATNLLFGEANLARNFKHSGYLGIAGTKNTVNGGPAVLKAMFDKKLIPSNEIGVYLAPRGQNGSSMQFGNPTDNIHVDTNKMVTISPGSNKNVSDVNVDHLKMNDTEVATGFRARLNTGLGGIAYPSIEKGWKAADKIFPDMTKGNLPAVGCQRYEKLTISIEGTEFLIAPEDTVGHKLPDEYGDLCEPNIYAHGAVNDVMWILGTAFLRNVYSSYNFETGETKIFGLKE